MKPFPDNKKRSTLILFLTLAAAFSLRLYGATVIPWTHDEKLKVAFAKEINFSWNNLRLPMGSTFTEYPPMMPYLIKIGMTFFGETPLAGRLPSVILGTLTLLIVYLLVKKNIDEETALLSVVLMSFSQYCIAFSRIASDYGPALFFAAGVLLFVQDAVIDRKRRFLWLAGVFLGLGLFTVPIIVTIIPIVVYYVFFYRENKDIFPLTDLGVFLLIALIITSPSILWNLTHGYGDYVAYSHKAHFFTISLIPTAFFLGEIIVAAAWMDDAVISSITSCEYPFPDWLMGLLCLAGTVYAWRVKKNDFMKMLCWLLYFSIVFFALVRPTSGGGQPYHLDNFWWFTIALIPGVIFSSHMLVELSKRHKAFRIAIVVLCAYFIYDSLQFVNFPANCFIPNRSLQLEELKNTASQYLADGKDKEAQRVMAYIKTHFAND